MEKASMADAAPDCSLCGGTGMRITQDEQGDRVAAVCSCRVVRQALRRLERAGIPRSHEHANLPNFESVIPGTSQAQESMLHAHFKANQFVVEYPHITGGRGLMFVGQAGRGKTHLAVGVLRALIEEKGCEGLFCDYGDLLKQIQNSYNPRSETSEYELLDPVLEAQVLVLDDLGSAKPTTWVLDTVAHVLNSRYSKKRTTIITTNFPNKPVPRGKTQADPTLGDRIGDRMLSRLAEMCVCIELLGEDFRQSAGAVRFDWSDAQWLPSNE
jgi:DNA replication protein DnaC